MSSGETCSVDPGIEGAFGITGMVNPVPITEFIDGADGMDCTVPCVGVGHCPPGGGGGNGGWLPLCGNGDCIIGIGCAPQFMRGAAGGN